MLSVLLRRDRLLVLGALSIAAAIAWSYLLLGAGMDQMGGMAMGDGGMMPMAPVWSPGYAALVFLMWASMMTAMMLPGAAPTILLAFALLRERGGNRTFGPTGLFVLGYLAVWFGFSLAAVALQWGLSQGGMLSASMISSSRLLAGLLIAAGLYQWTPLKQACLVRCRSPAEQLTRFWRRGRAGPFLSGVWNGAYCLGCCWLLMGLLFVGGVMNLLWIALIAVLVLIEKALPAGALPGRVAGMALIAWGAIILFR